VPCNNSFPTTNPCGTGGTWSPSGSFSGVNDTANMDCPIPCTANSRGIFTATFTNTNDTLVLAASTHGALAKQSVEDGGKEENFLTLASELGSNRWVLDSAANGRCIVVPKAPSTNDTRNITNNSNLPISFEYWCGAFSNFFSLPVASRKVDMLSIVDPKETSLTGSAIDLNNASRLTFVPAEHFFQVKDITNLSVKYVVNTGSILTGFTTLDTPMPLVFSDCSGGSFRIELQLLDKQTFLPQGIAKVYLGTNASDAFKSGCISGNPPPPATTCMGPSFPAACSPLSDVNLVTNSATRVDFIPDPTFGTISQQLGITFKALKTGSTGGLLVRKIPIIVDNGETPIFANHKVTFFDARFNNFLASAPVLPSNPDASSALEVVTGVTRIFDLPIDPVTGFAVPGTSIVISKLSSPSCTNCPKIVSVIPSTGIVINGNKFTSSVKVVDIQAESGASYSFNLCVNGSEEAPLTDPAGCTPSPTMPGCVWKPRGICLPDQGLATLQ